MENPAGVAIYLGIFLARRPTAQQLRTLEELYVSLP
jgi:hypothetical protein